MESNNAFHMDGDYESDSAFLDCVQVARARLEEINGVPLGGASTDMDTIDQINTFALLLYVGEIVIIKSR